MPPHRDAKLTVTKEYYTAVTAAAASGRSGQQVRWWDQCLLRSLSVNAGRVAQNVSDLRGPPPALGWMEGRKRTPKGSESTKLSGGTKVGQFWQNCKWRRLCGRPPYDRLLNNPVLGADYQNAAAGPRRTMVSPEAKVRAAQAQ